MGAEAELPTQPQADPFTPTAMIAEDEPLLAMHLQAELRRLWPQLRLLPAASDGLQAVEIALQARPDIVFLDIRMPGATGLEAAQAIVEDWPDALPLPLIVFVTAFKDFALAAFDAHAVDYLVKPVTPERLGLTVHKLQARLAERAHAPPAALDSTTIERLWALLSAAQTPSAPQQSPLLRLQAQVGNTIHLVPIEDVIYFEAADKYVRVVTAQKEHLIRLSLRELLPRLDPNRFWQIHRGTVVNMQAVESAESDDRGKLRVVLRHRPERLDVSRLHAPRFKGQ